MDGEVIESDDVIKKVHDQQPSHTEVSPSLSFYCVQLQMELGNQNKGNALYKNVEQLIYIPNFK